MTRFLVVVAIAAAIYTLTRPAGEPAPRRHYRGWLHE